MYDVIIAGGGPAGLNAALYAGRAGLSCLLLEKMFAGGQMTQTTELENYLGFPNGIGAIDLAMEMEAHAKKFGARVVREEILSMDITGEVKKVVTKKGEYEAKTIVLSFGASASELGVPGEQEKRGMGVSYCATCDGAFYKDKVTCVVGGGDTALEDALFLARLCEKVYLIHRRDAFRGAKVLQDKVLSNEKIEFLPFSVVEKINGSESVTDIDIKNVKTGEVSNISCSGVFIAVGPKPNSALLADLGILDERGYVLTDENMKTNIDGVFAAGDLRKKPLRQVITAAADGAVAINSVMTYLNEKA